MALDFVKDVLGEPQYLKLMDQLSEYAGAAQEAGLLELRPWSEFFSKFKAPKHWRKEDIEKRITVNFTHYKANYAALSCATFALMLVTSPLLLFVLLLCGGIWFYALAIHPGPLAVGGATLDETKKLQACGGATVLVLLLSGQFLKLLGTLALAGLLAVGHMVLRQRHVRGKASNAVSSSSSSSSSSTDSSAILSGIFSKAAQKKKDKIDEDMEGGGLGDKMDQDDYQQENNNPYDNNNNYVPSSGTSSSVNHGHTTTAHHRPTGASNMNY